MQSRTSYYPIAFSLFAAGLPPEKPLYRKNSRILIEKSLDEDGADAGLGIAGKGLGYYNFGMRYYDPELGIWLTQDMRLQFHSPYAYVANPLIYIDPNGLWSLGIGLVFGYDDQHGWHVGVGVAADFSDEIGIGVNVSYVANEDNSQTATVSAAASIEAAYASAGYQYNTKTGHSLSANIGVSVGVGYEAGTNQFWSTDGSYVGGRIYSKQFIGFRSANIGVVHQEGFGRVSSGFYLEASAMGANWSNDMDGEGWDFTGFEMTVPLATINGGTSARNSAELRTTEGGLGHNSIVGSYDGHGFFIAVGAADWQGELLALLGWRGGNSASTSGEGIPLQGADVYALYMYSKGLDWLDSKGLLPYSGIAANCSFYTSLAMNLAGVNNLYAIFPFVQRYQLQHTQGWGL